MCVCVGGKFIKLKLFSVLNNFLKDFSGFVGDEDQAEPLAWLSMFSPTKPRLSH